MLVAAEPVSTGTAGSSGGIESASSTLFLFRPRPLLDLLGVGWAEATVCGADSEECGDMAAASDTDG